MPRYIEFKCTNPDCEYYLYIWEAYVSTVSDGDGGFEYIPSSDGPATPENGDDCPNCGEQGDEI